MWEVREVTLMELEGQEDAVKRTPRLLNGHESEDLLKTQM